MLDLYFIYDDEATPEYPDEERFLGSINLDQHMALSELWELCRKANVEISYFDDSRIDSSKALTVANMLPRCNKDDSTSHELYEKSYRLIDSIFKKAVAMGVGVVSFCD